MVKFKISLHWYIPLAIIAGVATGYYFPDYVIYINWIGNIYFKLLTMLVIPSFVIIALAGMSRIGNIENFGRILLKSIVFYSLTAILAVINGISIANIFTPGHGANLITQNSPEGLNEAKSLFGSELINIIPENLVSSLLAFDILSILAFAILFGFFVNKVKEKQRVFLTDLFNSLADVLMRIIQFFIKFAPLGIVSLIAKFTATQVTNSTEFQEIINRLGGLVLVVLLGFVLQGIITWIIFVKLVSKTNMTKLFMLSWIPTVLAFVSSSSVTAFPATMHVLRNKIWIPHKISGVVATLGAYLNPVGGTLYSCAAVIFIGQAYGIHFELLDYVIIVFTSVLASIGASQLPMSNLIVISVILTALQLPLESVTLLFIADRIIDMFKNGLNVWTDCCGAISIAKSENERLKI